MKKKSKPSEEDLVLQNLERSLVELREDHYIPEPPNYVKYDVGQRVQIGNIYRSIVTEVLDGGKIYKLHQFSKDNHYGKIVDSENDRYVPWYNISPYYSIEALQSMETYAQKDTLSLSFSQMELRSIFMRIYHFGLDMNPEYQRGNVWSMDDKLKLLSSIFQNVDIGKFAFVHLPFKHHSPSYEVLDGKQRIIALTEFYECRYKFNGKYFKDLNYRDQGQIERHPISVADLRDEQVKLSDKYLYFLRLNTGGKVQDPKHMKYVEELYKKALAEGK